MCQYFSLPFVFFRPFAQFQKAFLYILYIKNTTHPEGCMVYGYKLLINYLNSGDSCLSLSRASVNTKCDSACIDVNPYL